MFVIVLPYQSRKPWASWALLHSCQKDGARGLQINSSQCLNLSAMAWSEEKSSNWQLALSFLSQAGPQMADLISFNAAISACEHFALQSACLVFLVWVQYPGGIVGTFPVPPRDYFQIFLYTFDRNMLFAATSQQLFGRSPNKHLCFESSDADDWHRIHCFLDL